MSSITNTSTERPKYGASALPVSNRALLLEQLEEAKWRTIADDYIRTGKARYRLHSSLISVNPCPSLVEVLEKPRGMVVFDNSAPGKRVSNEQIDALKDKLAKVKAGYFKNPDGSKAHITGCNVAISCRFQRALSLILKRITDPGDKIIIMPPCYPRYEYVAIDCGLNVTKVPLVNDGTSPFTINIDEITKVLADESRANTPRTKCIIIPIPNNPSGTSPTKHAINVLESLAKKYNCMLIFDDTFDSFCEDGPRIHITLPNSVILGSFSETYSLPSDRVESLGYAIGEKSFISKLKELAAADPAPTSYSQGIAIMAIQHREEHLANVLPRLKSLQAYARNVLEHAVPYIQFSENRSTPFLLVSSPRLSPTIAFAQELLEKTGILISPGNCFGSVSGFRLGLGDLKNESSIRSGIQILANYLRNKLSETTFETLSAPRQF